MARLVLITGISFVVSFALVRLLVTSLGKLGMGQVIREEMPDSHQKKGKTPMMGGIGIFLSAAVVTITAGGLGYRNVRIVLAVSAVTFLLGLADDLFKFFGRNTKGVGARYKLIIEILLGLILAYYMLNREPVPRLILVPWGEGVMDLGALFVPFVVFVFVGALNSVNFTDGVDGLVSGCFIAVAAAFVILVSHSGERELVPMLCAVCGAVAAFLWFNSHPASIFMGDSGSLFLGGFIAAVSIVTRAEIFLAVAGLVFVAEVISVIIQVASFRITKRRVFKMAPLHHHFELSGWSETHVSQRFWIASLVFSGLALALFVA